MRKFYLDALKGVALLIMLLGIIKPDKIKWFSYSIIIDQFEHVSFTGLHLLDMVLPIFIFCSGTGLGLKMRNKSYVETNEYYIKKSIIYFILAAVLYFKAFNGPYYRVDSVLFTFSILYAFNTLICKIGPKTIIKIVIASIILHLMIDIYVGVIDGKIIYSYKTDVFSIKENNSIFLLISRLIGIINLYAVSYIMAINSHEKINKYINKLILLGLIYFLIIPIIPKIFSNHFILMALMANLINVKLENIIIKNTASKMFIELGRASLFVYIIATGFLKEIFQTIDLFIFSLLPSFFHNGVVRSITFILVMMSLAYWYNFKKIIKIDGGIKSEVQ